MLFPLLPSGSRPRSVDYRPLSICAPVLRARVLRARVLCARVLRAPVLSLLALCASGLLAVAPSAAFVPPSPGAELDTDGRLRVSGTPSADRIELRLEGDELWVLSGARAESLLRTPAAGLTSIEVRAGDGDDHLKIDPRLGDLEIGIELYGEAGEDVLVGASGEGLVPSAEELGKLVSGLERGLALLDEARELAIEGARLAKRGHDDLALPTLSQAEQGSVLAQRALEELMGRLGGQILRGTELLELMADSESSPAERRAEILEARAELNRILRQSDYSAAFRRPTAGQGQAEAESPNAEQTESGFFARLEAEQRTVESILAGLEAAQDGDPGEELGFFSSRSLARRAENWAETMVTPPEPLDPAALDPTALEAFGEALERDTAARAETLLRASEALSARAEALGATSEQLELDFRSLIGGPLNALAEGPSDSPSSDSLQRRPVPADFDCEPMPWFTFNGGPGNDTLIGTPISDAINGGLGNDFVFAWSGDDEIDGGPGDDILLGSGGRDVIHGRAGRDLIAGLGDGDCLYGEGDRDVMLGGPTLPPILGAADSGDAMRGGDAEDLMFGNLGRDRMEGGDGIDLMFGNRDADRMEGEGGTTVTMPWGVDVELGNLMFGNRGTDRMLGGTGVDLMFGNRDADHLSGGEQVDVIFGNTGNDTIEGEQGGVLFHIQGVPVRLGNLLFGNQDEDVVRGGPDLDVAFGNQDDDRMEGGDGSLVLGGIDSDFLFGNRGDDTINGGRGVDFVFGNQGDDVLDGDDGAVSFDISTDLIFGNQGEDTIDGGRDFDLLFGNQDDDYIEGGAGIDLAFGNRGCDVLRGEGGTDLLFGNRGVDDLDGGDGWDGVFGNRDHDTVRGGAGMDLVSGDRGCDVVDGGSGPDLVLGGADDDIAFGGPGLVDLLHGWTGNDALWGEQGSDVIFGNRGQDCLDGGPFPDLVSGDRGEDDVMTGPGAIDIGLGGAGNDRLWGQGGTDLLCGGSGNDEIDGGAGLDFLYGNSGFDRIWGGPGPDICRGEVEDGDGSNISPPTCNRPAPRCIRGVKFHDLDGDGQWDEGEPTIAGWPITLRQGDELVASVTTDSDGRWAVCDLPTGCYTAIEQTRRCWTATTAERQEVMLSAVKDAVGVDFGNRRAEPCDPDPGPCDCSPGDPPCVPEPEVGTAQGCDRSGGTISMVTFSGISCGSGSYECDGPGQLVTDPDRLPPGALCRFYSMDPGTHTYGITDDSGRRTEVEVTVEDEIRMSLLDTLVEQPTKPSCEDGSIELEIWSASDEWTVRWIKDGEDIPTPETPLADTGLDPGMYSVTVTDENGCYVEAEVTLECACPDPEDPNITYYSQDPAECEDWNGSCGVQSLAVVPTQRFDDECGCGCIRNILPRTPNFVRFHFLSSHGGGGSTFVGDALELEGDDGAGWGLAVEPFQCSAFGIEVGAMELPGLEVTLGDGAGFEKSSVDLRLFYAGLHWRPFSLGSWNLYLGPFVGFADLSLPSQLRISEDPAFGAVLGMDRAIGSRGLTFSTSLRWLHLPIDVEDRRTGLDSEIELEPWILGLGVGYRF